VPSGIQRHSKAAGFPAQKHLKGFDYCHRTMIRIRQFNALLDFHFIDERNNLIFIYAPGVSKTHLAIGLGHKARPVTGCCFAIRWIWSKSWLVTFKDDQFLT